MVTVTDLEITTVPSLTVKLYVVSLVSGPVPRELVSAVLKTVTVLKPVFKTALVQPLEIHSSVDESPEATLEGVA